MEDDLNGRQPQWKKASMEDDLNLRLEDDLNLRLDHDLNGKQYKWKVT